MDMRRDGGSSTASGIARLTGNTWRTALDTPLWTQLPNTGATTTLLRDSAVHEPAWGEPIIVDQPSLVIVRRGAFQRRANGQEAYIGPLTAYFMVPGTEHQTAHPYEKGDATTLLLFAPAVGAHWLERVALPTPPVLMQAASDLAHRQLLAIVRRGTDALDIEERIIALADELIESHRAHQGPRRRAGTLAEHRRLVEYVHEAIAADPTDIDLATLAARVGYSPFHVSRTFTEVTGVSLTRFRNRVRSAIALQRMEDGEADLAGLALNLGFYDQAHMTRVISSEIGLPPGRIRRSLVLGLEG